MRKKEWRRIFEKKVENIQLVENVICFEKWIKFLMTNDSRNKRKCRSNFNDTFL